MSSTTPETVETAERTKCTAVQGGKKQGQPCPQWAQPGTDRCRFHPRKDAEIEAMQQRGETAIPSQAIRAFQSQAEQGVQGADPDYTDEPLGEDLEPLDVRQSVAPEPEDAPEGFVSKLVYDPEADDYVEKLVPVGQPRVQVMGDRDYQDEFYLDHKYREGAAAAFDYRWANPDPRILRMDKQNGFAPQRVSLDNRDEIKDGVVYRNGHVLLRRPKEVTDQRAREQAAVHEAMTGDAIERFHEEGRELTRAAGIDEPITFAGVSESGTPRETGPAAAQRAPEPARPRDAKTFFFANNPLARDKEAERRKAVGG